MTGPSRESGVAAWITWKDRPEPLPTRTIEVCAFCDLPMGWGDFDHGVCRELLINRGAVVGPFTRMAPA